MVPSPSAAERLRRQVGEEANGVAQLAFVIEAPSADHRLAVATDRAGLVVSRTPTVEEAVDVVAAHLLASETSGRSLAFRARAVVDADRRVAAVLQWPLGFAPPLVERRLDRAGWALVDRLVTEVVQVGSEPMLHCGSLRDCEIAVVGHAGAPAEQVAVASFVGTGEPTSAAMAVTAIAASSLPGQDRDVALDVATLLAGRWVGVTDHKDVYKALGR